ncbi:MAG: flippase-like domain-containing protein [Alphaproteobacteria bacterium]|nr:flippase-like domain-containing protein [Alphaproteobacteria bacterium]
MRQILLAAVKIVVTVVLLYFALRWDDLSSIFDRLDLWWIALAVAVTLFQILVGVLRWRIISTACAAPLGFTQALRYNMIGTFFNQTLPSAIGGDAVRLWLLARSGAGWRAATYSVFIDRAIGLIALAVLVIASLPFSYRLMAAGDGRTALLLVDLAALGAGLGFLILGCLNWPWLGTWWATRHIHQCAVITRKILLGLTQGPIVWLLSLSIHVLAVVLAWCVARSIQAPADFSHLFLLVPPVMLITMLPISIAGWGVREASMAQAFRFASLSYDAGAQVSVLFGAVYFIVGAAGGLVWLLSGEKVERPAEVPE